MFAQNAIFDLAVNRAAAFLRSAGPTASLAEWQQRTRFASRVNLGHIEQVLELRPAGEWHWAGGETGAWHPGKAPTP